jgi:hypothetical protein
MALFTSSTIPLPSYVTNSIYMPPGYYRRTGAVATTATRCYYMPFPIWKAHTFSGAVTFNQTTTDNGEKCRIMMFNDADGGPGTLAKDFGEITFTGASAARTLSSSWTASPGMYWAAIWFDSATAMFGMLPYFAASDAGAGGYGAVGFDALIGNLNSGANFDSIVGAVAHYVDTAYGAAPSTAVAPTATITHTTLATTTVVPVIGLKG